LNNRKISNRAREVHRYLGFFLAGVMGMYAISGITLTFRNTDLFKKEVYIEKTIEKGLSELPSIKGAKDIEYNSVTGIISYTQMRPPYVLDKIQKMHKATTNSPLYYFNVFFGCALLFFVMSAYWMFLPQTDIFKKAIYYTIGGLALAFIMVVA